MKIPVETYKRLSIKWKLLTIILALTTLGMVLSGWGLALSAKKIFQQATLSNLTILAEVIGDNARAAIVFADTSQATESLSALGANAHIIAGAIYDDVGKPFVSYTRKSILSDLPEVIPAANTHYLRDDYFVLFQAIMFQEKRIGTIYIKSDTLGMAQYVKSFAVAAVLLGLCIIAIVFLLAAKLQKLITGPIVNLAKAAKEISNTKNYTIRTTRESEDELGVLVDSFNNMLATIQNTEYDRDQYLHTVKEKNRELQQVIYVISHDLRSPLVNIQGFTKELSRSCEDLNPLLSNGQLPTSLKEQVKTIMEDDIPESLHIIQTSTAKMDSLLKGLLKLSRLGGAAMCIEELNMNEILSSIAKTFEFQIKEVNARLEIKNLPPCYGDATQINQVFANLIGNALKYLDPKRCGKIVVSGYQEADQCTYCVADNGIGIPGEYQQKIFEIFHRLNPESGEGEGLGLTIVQKILERHQGKIWLESKAGAYSKLFVSLSIAKFHSIG